MSARRVPFPHRVCLGCASVLERVGDVGRDARRDTNCPGAVPVFWYAAPPHSS